MFDRFLRRKQIEADLAEEMHEHLLARIEELVAQGMPELQARETARVRQLYVACRTRAGNMALAA